MTNEMFCKHICVMLQEYDLHTGNRGADNVISNPEKWIYSNYFPFYASAAELLIEIRVRLDTQITPRARLTAITRIYKNCRDSRPDMQGIFAHEDRFVICDGYRLLRLTNDISSLPHVKNDFDVGSVMQDIGPTEEILKLPTIGELRTFIAASKTKHGGKLLEPYCIDGFIWCNPQYLLDMIQALPECTAYKPKKLSSPIYFKSADGDDGILLPVHPPKSEENAKKETM